MKRKRRYISIIIASIITLAMIVFAMPTYTSTITTKLEDSAKATLNEIASQQQFAFDSELSTEIILLQSVANTLTIIGENEELIKAYISTIERYHKFGNISVVDIHGLGLKSDGMYVDVSDSEVFYSALEGKSSISNPSPSRFDNQNVVKMSTPIYEGTMIVGVLLAEYSVDYLNNLLLPSFDGDGYAFVIGEDGDMIAKTENDYTLITDNVYDIFILADFIESSIDEVRVNVQNGVGGSAMYEVDGLVRMMEYRPLDFNGWSLMVVAPEVVVSKDAAVIIESVNTYNYIVIGCAVLLIAFIVFLLRQSIKDVEKAAYYDELTGIPNTTKIKIDVAAMIRKNPDVDYTIVKFDVVNFKAINEIFNYEAGNKVIKCIADVGKRAVVKDFMQARVGTDEFILFARSEFLDTLEETRHQYEGQFFGMVKEMGSYQFEFRYGRYKIPKTEEEINDIFDKVALAHSFAKTENEIICDYDDAYKEHIIKTTEIKNKMYRALENNEYKVFLQPKYSLDNNTVVGAEALVRWIEPDGKMIFPNDFIPVFENNGFIVELDMHMLKGVCKVIKDWKDSGLPCVPVSVNFSRLHLQNPEFVLEIGKLADSYGIERKYIEVELTETTIIDNEKALQTVLEALHDGGFSLSMDDFGSGYSSLGLLKDLNVDIIKMDRSFFSDNEGLDRGKLVVQSMVEMAKRLNITTVAEGVETKEQADFLKSIDCEIAQGYFFARPIPAENFKYECFGVKRPEK